MGLPLCRTECSGEKPGRLRTASRPESPPECFGTQQFRGLLSLIIVISVVAHRRRNDRMSPDEFTCRNGTPAARRGRKATGLPAMGRLPGYRTGSLSSSRHGVCGGASLEEFLAMKVWCGHGQAGRVPAPAPFIANGSKGGRHQKNETGMFRWGNGGGYGRPLFYGGNHS